MSIASKEARESNYWLRLIRDSNFLEDRHVDPLLAESSPGQDLRFSPGQDLRFSRAGRAGRAGEIIRMLTSIVKTTSSSNSKLKTYNL